MKKKEDRRPRWLKPYVAIQRDLITRDGNVFGGWCVIRWPAMPPEAPVESFVGYWRTQEGVFATRPQLTLQRVINNIPITTTQETA